MAAADKRRRAVVRGGELRIIGGTWRGRRLRFPDTAGLRPTPDRVRETVFNWLAPWLPGAACLDLFAGSGAFGLEALSRGAARAVLVEHARPVADNLRRQVALLAADHAEVVHADALSYLRGEPRAFDIVFLDPPYGSGLLGPCCALLEERGWVVAGGLVYIETARRETPPLPATWTLLRSKHAGQVGYHLAKKTKNAEERS